MLLSLTTCGVLFLTNGCAFDTQAFLNTAAVGVLDSVASNFLTTFLSQLLNISPTFTI